MLSQNSFRLGRHPDILMMNPPRTDRGTLRRRSRMQLRVGSRWRSAVDDTQVVVVRAPQGDVSLTCGAPPLIPSDSQPTPGLTIGEGSTGGTALGKRYADP